MNHATLDGLIYVLIAFFGAVGAALGSDDAAKYIEPATLWYAKNVATALAAALLALKMFRSTTYADMRSNAVIQANAAVIQNMPAKDAP